MNKVFKKINKKQIIFIFLVIISSFFIALPAQANWITQFFGWIFAGIVGFLGYFLMMLINVLVWIAQYNNFIKSPVVVEGWTMVLGISNMFFVVILLIIAFSTILRIEKYNYKKWLPKLILMAILINFSKTICGLMIDAAQIIMLSFVNSFKTIGGTNFVNMMGITDWHELNEPGDGWAVMGAYFLAVVYVIIAIVVIAAMLGVLLMRIIMIWIYVVLSPLAFLLGSFPNGQTHASKWWAQFTENLIAGPVLAFFI